MLPDYEYVNCSELVNGYKVDKNRCCCLSGFQDQVPNSRPGLQQQYHVNTLIASMLFWTIVWTIVLAAHDQDQASVCENIINMSSTGMKWQCWAYHWALNRVTAKALRYRVAETWLQHKIHSTRHAENAVTAHKTDQHNTCKASLHQQNCNLSQDCDHEWSHDHSQDCEESLDCDDKPNQEYCACDVSCDTRYMVILGLMFALHKTWPSIISWQHRLSAALQPGLMHKTRLHKSWKKILPTDTDRLWACAIITKMLISMWHGRLHDNILHDFAWHSTHTSLLENVCWVTHMSCKHGFCILRIWQKIAVSHGAPDFADMASMLVHSMCFKGSKDTVLALTCSAAHNVV